MQEEGVVFRLRINEPEWLLQCNDRPGFFCRGL